MAPFLQQTERGKAMKYGKIKSFENGRRIRISFDKQDAYIDVITNEIVRVFVPLWESEYVSKAIESEKKQITEYSLKKEEEKIVIITDQLRVEVWDNFFIDVYRADGTPLIKDYRGERKKRENISSKAIQLLEAEGHDVSENREEPYSVQTVKAIDPSDCFYGLGDKSGFLNKRCYEYENWNSDLPQAHTEDFHALYKSIPFLIGLKEKAAYGLFFDNTFHSYVNIGKESEDYMFYGADGGNLDYYILGGTNIAEVIKNYTYLTGRTPLPQLWTLGYQQSRWGYVSANDIREVADTYRKLEIPCDVIHMDIDYMDDYKVFTWDEKSFDKKGVLVKELADNGYKPVTIIDPGVKLEPGYFMYEEGKENNYFATNTEGEIYVNEVWPGDSVFPDYGRREVRDWWADHHKILTDMGIRGIWNDMNEPASFKGELPLDVVFHDEERVTNHAEMHNIYGHCMSKAAFTGIKELTGKRPFIITRACYAGTQKYSTVWTGDNQSLWHHLLMVIPQLCNLGMSGFAFAGTDIGGFNADVTPELLCRWVEAGCFSPLFRNHSAYGTRRQEPWQFSDEVVRIYKKYVELRYRFIPYLYDLFYQGEQTGLPIMRPLVLHYENDPQVRNLNSEFLVGETLLVAPVLEQGATGRMIYLPEGNWYDFWTHEKVAGGQYILRDAPLDVCPMYIREGSIIPTYDVMQYVGEKPYDTLRLLVTPGAGSYTHFQDDGEDYAYQNGEYNLYRFATDESGKLTTTMMHENYKKYNQIEVVQWGKQ